jgi:hypothetical protein
MDFWQIAANLGFALGAGLLCVAAGQGLRRLAGGSQAVRPDAPDWGRWKVIAFVFAGDCWVPSDGFKLCRKFSRARPLFSLTVCLKSTSPEICFSYRL